MGWLQPPLGFTPDYNYPVQAPAVPPGTFESFADGSNTYAVKFFFFNGLAFFYAMGALFAVAGALIFMNNKQRDGRSVHFILERTTLNRISYGLYLLLYLSVLSMCLASETTRGSNSLPFFLLLLECCCSTSHQLHLVLQDLEDCKKLLHAASGNAH
jgi:hypothetical protein